MEFPERMHFIILCFLMQSLKFFIKFVLYRFLFVCMFLLLLDAINALCNHFVSVLLNGFES